MYYYLLNKEFINNLKEGHQVEAERNGENCKERMIKFRFSEKTFHQNNEYNVCHKLGHTGETGHVDVEAVLLLSFPDDLWPQNPR